MSDIVEYTTGSKNLMNIWRVFKHNVFFARNNPDYFYPAGIWVFTGPQGSGKTLSLINTLKRMLKDYPKAKVISNLHIEGVDYIKFEDYSQIETVTNGINGVIFVLDEIHTVWNSLESKEIPISEMSCFCQMRKDRRVILGTAQLRSRIAKPIREQLQYIIDCDCKLGCIQFNTVLDPSREIEENGVISAKIVARQLWIHQVDLYDSYDTLFKIVKPKRKEGKK